MPHFFHDRGAQNLLFAYRLLAGLVRAGSAHIVISPGSRSTPLTLSAAHLSARFSCPVSVMLDERSAGFFALGCGKATGRPAILICTSGTAAANYYPAVIEARMTQTPLIVISADRPISLQRKMSPQTIHQQRLFVE
ncbi:MAG: thiamine pyrophosphate-binding protein [Cyclonatronaceae bacterium]